MTELDDFRANQKAKAKALRAIKKAEKAMDDRITRAYYRTCSGVQINIMDIAKVYEFGRGFLFSPQSDADLDAAIVRFVSTIRKN